MLTGIGRFHEMSYILQLLMENDQFESLLHTNHMEKVQLHSEVVQHIAHVCTVHGVQEEQLRVALMDYLKTHHPNDHEKMQMVALKFGMFYELAKSTQEQAKEDLRKIKSKHLGEDHHNQHQHTHTPTCT